MTTREAPAGPAANFVACADSGGVATLTLNDPASRNALSDAMLATLEATLAAIAADRAVKAVVLRAEGPVFCSGHNLKDIMARRADPDRGRAYFVALLESCARVMLAIERLPQPVIAAVQGPATAAGCQLVATCDLAIASDKATFATPGVHIGLFCSTPMVALSRNVTNKHAMEMLLIGDPLPASEAVRIGLVNRQVPAGRETAEAERIARLIAAKASATVRVGKRAFYEQREMTREAAYRHASAVMVDNMLARDAEEGVAAFVQKRPPVWTDAPAPPRPPMNHDAYPDAYIRDILSTTKTIAMVGASANEVRPSYFVLKYLLERGYRVFPINPGLAGKEILGRTVYARLADIPEPVDMVDVFRNSEAAAAIIDEALALPNRPKTIWMQLSVRNDDAAARAEAAGVQVVMNRCPKIELGRLSTEISWMGVNSRTISSRKPPHLKTGKLQRLGLRDTFGGGGDR